MTSSTQASVEKKGFDRALWKTPPVEYSQCPFWFWNDELDESEILRQMDDFQAHGVDAFVIHPRIGLPASITWLSEKLFYFMHFAVEEASRRGMWVVLYDEGMYPSGSSAGMVVEKNPAFRVRGLTCLPEGEELKDDFSRNVVATLTRQSGERVVVYDQAVDSVVRGLHYLGDDPESGRQEEEHCAADLLNPAAVQCFIELVYERFYQELGKYFGNTVIGIFTDEPHPLGRIRTPNAMPGTTGILEEVNAYLGYDFTPHLPALWFDDEPDAAKYRRDYDEAIAARLNETYYKPLYNWCEKHQVALVGHPADPDDFGHLDYFQIPGQDIVWRHIEPHKPSALEGPPSTMAKAAASAAYHYGRKRNLNEFAGAYGHELTFFELRWLASWLLIRGCNMLMPHAFYYSMRGPRKDERPTEVGPHSAWWKDYLPWAIATKRLCWLNAEFQPVCQAAILGRSTELPWEAAKICFENQVDFHYLNERDLADCTVSNGSIRFRNVQYKVVVTEEKENHLIPAGATALSGFDEKQLPTLLGMVSPVVVFDQPAPSIRFRHLQKEGVSLVLLFNEGPRQISRSVDFKTGASLSRLDLTSGTEVAWKNKSVLELEPSGWAVFLLENL